MTRIDHLRGLLRSAEQLVELIRREIAEECQTAEIVEGAEVAAEPTEGATPLKAEAPEIEAGLAGEAAAPAPIVDRQLARARRAMAMVNRTL